MNSKDKKRFYESIKEHVARAQQAKPSYDVAVQAMQYLDLTYLGDEKDPKKVAELCAKARAIAGHHTAAVCVYPEFIAMAAQELAGTDIKIATVINFPFGNLTNDGEPATPENTKSAIAAAIADGAHEIDIVYDYNGYHEMEEELGRSLLQACREACGDKAVMKVILETSSFHFEHDIYDAGRQAVKEGADMLKTSTGKHPDGGATLHHAFAMICAARDAENYGRRVGVKISGGVKDVKDCAEYMVLAKNLLGETYMNPQYFRFGASGVYEALAATIKGVKPPMANKGRPSFSY